MADVVLWDPKFFGVKPELVFKSGFIAYSMMGDPNASIPTVQPIWFRPMFGAFGSAQTSTSAIFSSKIACELNIKERYGLDRSVLPVHNTRNLGKNQMIRNDTVGTIEIDPETYRVKFDGKLAECEPAEELPLSQLYYLY
jgi:urease subunit alpha